MSVQTIIHKSIPSLVDEAIKNTIKNLNKFWLKKRFKLGKGYCENEQFHNSMIIETDKLNSCPLIQYVNGIIENGPDDCFKADLSEDKECGPQKTIDCSIKETEEEITCTPPIANAGSNFTHQMNTVNAGTTNTGNIDGSLSEHNSNSFQLIVWDVVETPNNIDNGSGSYIFIQNPNQLTTTIVVTNNPVAVGLWKLSLTVTNDCGETATSIVEIILEQNNPK